MKSVVIYTNEFLKCEPLLFSENNIDLVKEFKVKRETGLGLQYYINEFAVEDEINHNNRTYLIKDIVSNELVGYFSLKSGNDERAAFCLSPGKALNNGSTYKSSELNAGYAKKYYAAALAYYYKDGHNTGNDRYTYRAVTQMFIWRIAKYKESTSKDFTAKQLNSNGFESCVKNTLSTMNSAGKVTLSKSVQNYYDEAVKEIFMAGEKKTYNNDVSFVKWSDGAGQILLTGKYSPQEDVFVNLKIKKSGIDANGNKIDNANLAGVEYRVYNNRG